MYRYFSCLTTINLIRQNILMETNKKYQKGIHNNQLRKLRHEFELRQTDMADVMGFEVIDRICHWERGRAVPGLINTIRLCALFGKNLKELYPDLYKQIEEEILESKNENFLKNLMRTQ
jgi:DNA-binding XRE family transcriptional regulator